MRVDPPVSTHEHRFSLKNPCSSRKNENDGKLMHQILLASRLMRRLPESELEDHEDEHDDEVEYKKVEPVLREWIETKGCRRDVADEYFNNPPNRRCKFYSLISSFFSLNCCS